jgi:hypothetical protein
MMEIFFPQIEIYGFVDSYKDGSWDGKEIVKPEEVFNNDNCVIIVGVLNCQREVMELIENHGKVYNKDYFLMMERVCS